MKSSHRRNGGFTLIEVLVTLMLLAIVLPAVMQGISLATAAGSTARRRTEAAALAESKLAALVASGEWQNGGNLGGDFGADWPDYHWQATVQPWVQSNNTSAATATNVSLQEIDLRVTWLSRGRGDSVTLSTLAYARSSQ